MLGQKQFTREEVQKANSRAKTMFILHDKVYDVTSFLNEHPGGEEILLDHGGKDASEDFDDVSHSADAFVLMKNYQIGEVVESERRNIQPKKGWVAGYNNKNPEKEKYIQGPGLPVYLLVGSILLVVITVLYFR